MSLSALLIVNVLSNFKAKPSMICLSFRRIPFLFLIMVGFSFGLDPSIRLMDHQNSSMSLVVEALFNNWRQSLLSLLLLLMLLLSLLML